MTSRIAKCPHCERWVPSVPYQDVKPKRFDYELPTPNVSDVAPNDPAWRVVTVYALECPTCVCSEPWCNRKNPVKNHAGVLLCRRCIDDVVTDVYSPAHAHLFTYTRTFRRLDDGTLRWTKHGVGPMDPPSEWHDCSDWYD